MASVLSSTRAEVMVMVSALPLIGAECCNADKAGLMPLGLFVKILINQWFVFQGKRVWRAFCNDGPWLYCRMHDRCCILGRQAFFMYQKRPGDDMTNAMLAVTMHAVLSASLRAECLSSSIG
jgi:hypothetical protein